MFGLAVMFFFGVTGFTANHEDWFGATLPRETSIDGQTPPDLIRAGDALRIVEHLRKTYRVSGEADYRDLDQAITIGFKEPGQSWDVEIEKETGKTSIKGQAFNFVAVINNLHRGRYSGTAWKWVIDISAAFIAVACFTGVVLWLVLPKRRKIGAAMLFAGTLATLAIYVWLVP